MFLTFVAQSLVPARRQDVGMRPDLGRVSVHQKGSRRAEQVGFFL